MTQKSSLEKALSVFDLFETDRMEWSLEEIAEELGVAQSTCYRYMRLLSNLGFVVASPSGHFTIGPRVTLLEYRMRLNDPLIRAAEPFARALARDWPGTALVNRAFRDEFVCIYRTQSGQDTREMFARGHAMPRVSGAHARILQAWLSRHRLTKLYRANEDAFAAAGHDTLEDLFRSLRQVRKDRVCLDEGGFRADSVGTCAPILGEGQALLGSFSFTFAKGAVAESDYPAIVERVRDNAEAIGQALLNGAG